MSILRLTTLKPALTPRAFCVVGLLLAGGIMATVTHPTKEQVRAHMQRRAREHTPPPSPEDIRRELGWHMLPPIQQGKRR